MYLLHGGYELINANFPAVVVVLGGLLAASAAAAVAVTGMKACLAQFLLESDKQSCGGDVLSRCGGIAIAVGL